MQEKETSSSQRTASTEENSHTKENHFVDFTQKNSGDELHLQDEQANPKRSIWRKLNPFYMTHVPPVPATDAGLVPEMGASWLSKLTWGWMGSLMMVSHRR